MKVKNLMNIENKIAHRLPSPKIQMQSASPFGAKWLFLIGLFVIAFTVFNRNEVAFAANYYVDQSCTFDGNGLADQCASSSGAPGAYLDPQSCFSAVQAGDTCLIKNGTYITSHAGNPQSYNGGFHVDHSGTSSSRITIKNYPGHTPFLVNCSVSTAVYCSNPTITTNGQSYITFDGLKVQGAFTTWGLSDTNYASGITIQNSEITVGWDYSTDANWAGIFTQYQTNQTIQNLYMHDLRLTGGLTTPGGSCMKVYYNTNLIFQYNSCINNSVPATEGVDEKAHGANNIYRYNYFENIPDCLRLNNNQPLGTSSILFYGNVCYNIGFAGFQLDGGTSLDQSFVYNNTFYQPSSGVCVYSLATATSNISFYNNICYVPGTTSENGNYVSYGSALGGTMDYNRFQSGKQYRPDNTHSYSTLASFQSGYGKDLHSSETACNFVNPGTDFHLQTGGSCKGWGHVGGIPTGASVDVGAYGVTSCVGYGCINGPRDITPPSIPTGLLILP